MSTVVFEAFKAGEFDTYVRESNVARNGMTNYDFPSVRSMAACDQGGNPASAAFGD